MAPDPATGESVAGSAFLPDRLPRTIELSSDTWMRVTTATAALARLDGAARLIPNPELLRVPALRREAQSTSALEGTYAPFADVLAADPDDAAAMSAELREVLNFEEMAGLAFTWPESRPLTIGMLSELQRVLVHGTVGELSDSGRLRDRIVVIGSRGRQLSEARFVPPPPGDQLRSELQNLLEWIGAPPNVPSVVQAAMAHYQFETLHPFSDGNGRLGRLLIVVQLLRGAVIREPLLVVSPWFEQRRDEYQDALLELSCNGDWNTWINFFAEGVAASAADSQAKVERLVQLQAELRATVQSANKRGVAERLAGDLIGHPFVSRSDVAKRYGISGQGAANAIAALTDLRLLSPTQRRSATGAQRFVSDTVLSVLLT
ncbi:Fic family protein [Conexibacter woesei]|nr:Fic/DOC family N-terminal domain-containing protein [Conexibacter woesei]